MDADGASSGHGGWIVTWILVGAAALNALWLFVALRRGAVRVLGVACVAMVVMQWVWLADIGWRSGGAWSVLGLEIGGANAVWNVVIVPIFLALAIVWRVAGGLVGLRSRASRRSARAGGSDGDVGDRGGVGAAD